MRTMCAEYAKLGDKSMSSKLENMFFGISPSQVLYNLEVSIYPIHKSLYKITHIRAFMFKLDCLDMLLHMLQAPSFLSNA